MFLKTDFHLHSKEDQRDIISYTAKELIDYLVEKGYHTLSLTFHDSSYSDKKTKEYAKEKGITLIPGIEKTIEGAHILILNAQPEELKEVTTLKDLEKIKREDTLLVAAHPFFFINSLGKRLEKNIHLFDAIEYAHFYLSFLNFNKKAVKLAKRYNKPLLGNSDTHYLFQVGYTYSIVETEHNDTISIIKAIKEGKVMVKSMPLPFFTFLKISIALFLFMSFKIWKRRWHY